MAPQISHFAVFRAGLVRRLDEAVRNQLTLLVAPPGYGKSMLLAQWAATNAGRHVAWLTLDAADGNAVTFARSLVASLQRVHAGVGSVAAERIGMSGASMGDEFLVALLEDLTHVPETVMFPPLIADSVPLLIQVAPVTLSVLPFWSA